MVFNQNMNYDFGLKCNLNMFLIGCVRFTLKWLAPQSAPVKKWMGRHDTILTQSAGLPFVILQAKKTAK